MKRMVKKYRYVLISLLLIILTLYGVGYYLNTKLNNFVINLSEKITREIGHPVKIGKVTNNWDWLYLKINITDLVISDQATNIPLFMASSIVGTVDAVQSVLSLNLKFKNLLLRDPRLVLQWDGIAPPVILGLGGEDLPGRIDPKILLKLLSMQRKIAIENGDFHLQGIEKADLPIMDVKLDFIEKSKYEYNILARGRVAAAIPPEFNFAMNYIGDLNDFDKSMVDFELKTSLVKINELIGFMPSLNQNLVTGAFKDLDIKGTIQNGTLRDIKSNFSIDTIVVNQDTTITSGEGKIEFRPFKNKYNLSIANLKVDNHKLLSYPINIDLVRGEIIADHTDTLWDIKTEELEFKLLDMTLKSSLKMQVHNSIINNFEMTGKFGDAFIEKLLILLPDNLIPADLGAWLNSSLIDGFAESLTISYKPDNTFCALVVKEAELQYSADWPSIHGIDGSVIFENGEVRITSDKADILNNKINAVTTKFPIPFDTKNSVVAIDGSMDTTLEAGLNFLNQTTLKHDIADRLKEFSPVGATSLDLNLSISLRDDATKVIVNGDLGLKQATINAANLALPLTNIKGNVRFTNSTLKAENLDLEIFDRKATANISLEDKNNEGLQISVKTFLHIDDLKRSFKNLKLDNISGKANVLANLNIPWNLNKDQKVLTITSNLEGIAINYPAPFNKVSQDKWPLQLKYFINNDQTQNLYLNLPKLVDTNFVLSNGAIQSGHISFGDGNAVLASTNGLVISGKLAELNAEQWQPWLRGNNMFKSLPVELELLIDKLYFNGNKWNAMWIKYASNVNKWALENPLVKGSLQFSDENKVEVKLDRLEIETTDFKNNDFVNYMQKKRTENKLPLVQFYCEQLRVNKKNYRKVSFQLLPRIYGYEITEFSLSNEDVLLQAQGQWQMVNKEFTQLSGNAFTKNCGKALDSFGYNNSIARGDGEINFSLQWDGNPAKFDILRLEGASHIDLRNGSLTGVSPGLGRVIGLLSFESIQRRLKLDFSDLISKGFAFDKLSSDLKLRPGIAASENILINGPSARIELSGKTNLKSQELDFIMYVTPKVGAGLPIAAAIAVGNPAVGAAIWLFDKASGSKISEISRYKYKVTGTWNAPNIDEIIVKRESKNENENRKE